MASRSSCTCRSGREWPGFSTLVESGQQQAYALVFAFFGKAGEFGHRVAGFFTVQRGGVEFDVAGVENFTHRRFHGQSVATGEWNGRPE